jgi:hypothetical protein
MADSYEEDILDAFISCSSLQLALSASVLIACAVYAETTSETSALCVDQEIPVAGRSPYGA